MKDLHSDGVLVERRRRSHRAGIGAQRRARQETWAYVRQAQVVRVLLASMAMIMATGFGADPVNQAMLGHPAASWWTPFVLGLGAGALPCLIWIAVTSADGSATWRVGAEAERWTAGELDALGPSWLVEHDVPFPERTYVADVDHVAIGPYGVLAIETKWTSHEVDLSASRLAPEVEKAIRQARDGAGRVRALISRVNSGLTVIPVVVYWGPHVTPPLEPVRQQEGVRLVAGSRSADWRARLSHVRLDAGEIHRLAARVRDWRVAQEAKTVGIPVTSRLRNAARWGRTSIGLTLFMVVLLPLSKVPGPVGGSVDATFRLGGSGLTLAVYLLPLVTAVASAAFVWLARQLDPDVSWFTRLVPLGVWIAGFAGLMLASS